MAQTISIALQKGGVGKSTTAETVSSILGKQGKKVLLVDMDSQCNVTFISGADPRYTITDVFTTEAGIKEAICQCKYYDLLSGDEYLSNFERQENIKVNILKNSLSPIKNDYDYIIIDTPPALGNLLKSSLFASDYCLIPIDARPLAVKGLDSLMATFEAVKGVNPHFKVLGIALMRFNERTVLNRQLKTLLDERTKEMGTSLFATYIRDGIAVPEAQAMQISLIDYAPKSKPCLDYISLTSEILERMEKS